MKKPTLLCYLLVIVVILFCFFFSERGIQVASSTLYLRLDFLTEPPGISSTETGGIFKLLFVWDFLNSTVFKNPKFCSQNICQTD